MWSGDVAVKSIVGAYMELAVFTTVASHNINTALMEFEKLVLAPKLEILANI